MREVAQLDCAVEEAGSVEAALGGRQQRTSVVGL
jgi:hypothetical protein